MYSEGTDTASITTGNNDDSLALTKGTYQRLKRIRVAIPGGVGDIQIQFFNGTVAGALPISGALYLSAQPVEGFDLDGMNVTGTLGWRITGWTAGSTNAFLNISYNWN